MADIVDRTFLLLLSLFRQIPIPYAVIGGFAGNVWGVDRATLDIDLLVGGRQSQFDRLITLGTEQGLRPRDVHDHNVLRRRRQETFAGHVLWFPAPEDLILMKLKVGRDRDFDDAIRVVERNQANLNQIYLSRWAMKLGIVEELHYVLRTL